MLLFLLAMSAALKKFKNVAEKVIQNNKQRKISERKQTSMTKKGQNENQM